MISVREKGQDSERDEGRDEMRKARMDKNAMASPTNHLWQDILACLEMRKKPASDTSPVLSSAITAAQASPGRSSTKRGAKDTLESESKPDDTDADLDVAAQVGVHAVEIFAAKVHATVNDSDHISELLWYHTFTNSTSVIREALGVPEPTKGSRVLYILEFRKLEPITELHGINIFDVWRQCILCHVTLWKEGVYHLDVSPGNMKWYWKDGKRIGVLNDYDLSSLADDAGPRGNERTGTVPFMALDLLKEKAQRGEVKHLYRHDLESFVWVFIWICLRYKKGVLLPTGTRPLDKWATINAVACGKEKYCFLGDPKMHYPAGVGKSMRKFLLGCVAMLHQQYTQRKTAHLTQLLEKEEREESDDEEMEQPDDEEMEQPDDEETEQSDDEEPEDIDDEEMEQSDDEEPEDIDGSLRILMAISGWDELTSKLRKPSQ